LFRFLFLRLCFFDRTGRLDEALTCLRAFVARSPPRIVRETSPSPAPTQLPDHMRSTRVSLVAGGRPLVRLTTAGRTGRRRTAVADIRGHRGTAPSPRGGGRPARRRVRQVGVQGVRGCAAQAEGGDAQAGVIRVERTVGKFSLFKGSSPRVRWVVAAAATLTPLAPHTFRYHA